MVNAMMTLDSMSSVIEQRRKETEQGVPLGQLVGSLSAVDLQGRAEVWLRGEAYRVTGVKIVFGDCVILDVARKDERL